MWQSVSWKSNQHKAAGTRINTEHFQRFQHKIPHAEDTKFHFLAKQLTLGELNWYHANTQHHGTDLYVRSPEVLSPNHFCITATNKNVSAQPGKHPTWPWQELKAHLPPFSWWFILHRMDRSVLWPHSNAHRTTHTPCTTATLCTNTTQQQLEMNSVWELMKSMIPVVCAH